jgi:hypothetical protein
LFQNLEHSDYISQVQHVLDCHHVSPPRPKEPLVLRIKEQEIFQRHDRKGTFPTLQKLLSKAIKVKSEYLTSCQTFESNRTSPTSNLNLNNSRQQKLDLALSPKIQELETIIGIVAKSKSTVRRQYRKDLFQSLKALQQFRSASQEQQHNSVNATKLAAEISKARLDIQNQLDQLRKALEREESAH